MTTLVRFQCSSALGGRRVGEHPQAGCAVDDGRGRRGLPAPRAAGFTRDPGENNTCTTFGIELKPIPNIELKVDHMWVHQFNVDIGYAFQ